MTRIADGSGTATVDGLKGRSLLTLREYSPAEIGAILDTAATVKREKADGVYPRRLEHRNIALVFLKPSARTRMSFVVAAADEGAHPEIFRAEDIRFGVKESTRDIARLTGRLFDGIAFRGFDHAHAEELAEHSGIPVWNALTDLYHPTQALADLFTMREAFGELEGLPVVYVGDGRNNLARSLVVGAAKTGLDLRILAPEELQPERAEVDEILGSEPEAGSVLATADADEALRDAAVVYNDVWVSMGEEELLEERIALLRDYKVTPELMARTGRSDTVYLHCLPALHDLETEFAREHPDVREVDDEVFEGPQSRAFDLAENRMHTIKALMLLTL
jgi:ornithine carbamoyltransferase